MTAKSQTDLKALIVSGGVGRKNDIHDIIDSLAVLNSDPGNGVEMGDGTARDLTVLFNLDVDQTLIWDESENEFVLSNDLNLKDLKAVAGTFTGNVKRSVTAGITAFATGGQGSATQLTTDINEISVCATAGDSVKMPTAIAGLDVVIINNGAKSCDVFPSSGDNLGSGVDTAVSLGAGNNIIYTCYNTTNWEKSLSGGGGLGDFSAGGDATGADRTLGNTDNFDLGLITNNLTRAHIQKDGKVGFGTTDVDEHVHFAKAVDGEFVGLLIENSQAHAGGSVNETVELRFGFGGDNDVARITVTKKGDYIAGADKDSSMRFWIDINGTATQIASMLNSGLLLNVAASKVDFNGTAGGGGQGLRYKDAGGLLRSAFQLPGSDLVVLSNQAADGSVEIRANTSTAGSGGEVTIARFEDDKIGFFDATPATQAAHIVDADGTLADITTKFNNLLVALDADAGVGLLAGV